VISEADDLISRLRSMARAEHDDLSIGDEAADCIAKLRAEVERLRGALIETLPHICSALCPSVKGTHEQWGHHRICKLVDAALRPAPPPAEKCPDCGGTGITRTIHGVHDEEIDACEKCGGRPAPEGRGR
jgi:predicted RNA-binding Zn-ribbon protein involved in translation (DUF1610 family)